MNGNHLKKASIALLCCCIVAFILLNQKAPENTATETEKPPHHTSPQNTQNNTGSHIEAIATTSRKTVTTSDEGFLERHNEQDKEQRIAELLKQRLTPTMRKEINAMLKPSSQNYTEVTTENGGYINLGKRVVSVPVAVIDDNGNLIVTDVSSQLDE